VFWELKQHDGDILIFLLILPWGFNTFADNPLNAEHTDLICKTGHKH